MPDLPVRFSGAMQGTVIFDRDVHSSTATSSSQQQSGSPTSFSDALDRASSQQPKLKQHLEAHDRAHSGRSQIAKTEHSEPPGSRIDVADHAHRNTASTERAGEPLTKTNLAASGLEPDSSAALRFAAESTQQATADQAGNTVATDATQQDIDAQLELANAGERKGMVDVSALEKDAGLALPETKTARERQIDSIDPIRSDTGTLYRAPSDSLMPTLSDIELTSAGVNANTVKESMQEVTSAEVPSLTADASVALGMQSEVGVGRQTGSTTEFGKQGTLSNAVIAGSAKPVVNTMTSADSLGSGNSVYTQADQTILPLSLATRLNAETRNTEATAAVSAASPPVEIRVSAPSAIIGLQKGARPQNTDAVPLATSATDTPLVSGDAADRVSAINSNLHRSQSSMEAEVFTDAPLSIRAATNNAATTANNPLDGSLMSTLLSGADSNPKEVVKISSNASLGGSVLAGSQALLPDNMLADFTSGTVTAPTITRTDSVGTQIVSAPMNVALLAPAASDALAGNVRWMVNEGVQQASVTVSPAGMGPIAVKIGIENEQMNVSLMATQGTTREALEAMLPRLREQLVAQGHDSVRVDVSDGKSDNMRGNANQQQAQDRQSFGSNQNFNQHENQPEHPSTQPTLVTGSAEKLQQGERPLSDKELARVARMQGLLPDSAKSVSAIQHGYDLYV